MSSPESGPLLDFVALRAAISFSQILRDLDYQPVSIHGSSWRGPCPLHAPFASSERCFSVNVERSVYQCFRCGAKGNQLDFWAAFRGLPLYEAALDLCHRHGVTPPYRSLPLSKPQRQNRDLPTTDSRNPADH